MHPCRQDPPSRSRPTRRSPRAARGERGYVLFIVLVLGVAAGLAATALLSTRGGTQIASMHTELSDRSHAYAEAGMQRAIFYLNDVLGNFGDFDAALDTNLDATCGGAGTPTPDSTDLRPDTGASDSDPLVEWSDGFEELIGGKYYSCVSVPGATAPSGAALDQQGGRYCVRFEDDDDDAVDTDLWRDTTGNNEDPSDPMDPCHPNGCLEGLAGVDTACGHHNGGANNPLRDRNRAIWVVAIGIYPDVPFDQATHRTTLRRMHMAPRVPTVAGLSVKGNVNTGSGSSVWYACSDVAAVAIDGDAEGHTATNVCASGYSRAHEWENFSHCADIGACSGIPFGSGVTIDPLPGELESPGPNLDDLPDPWDRANQWVDFDRSCVFWVDNGVPTGPGAAPGLPGGKDSLWVWDARANRGPGGARCGTFETVAGEDASFPGPPGPSHSPGGAQACGDVNNPNCWRGCWTPLLFMDPTIPTVIAPPLIGPSNASGFTNAAYKCYQPIWRQNVGGWDDIILERPLAGLSCNWHPNPREGWYRVCNNASSCYQWGDDDGSTHGNGAATDPLNQRLASMGIPTFPPGTVLRKPAWQSECQITYPPPTANLGPPTTYACSGCTQTSLPIVPAPEPSADAFSVGNNRALAGPIGGQNQIWFRFNSQSEVRSAPAGVYYFSDGFSLTGSNYEWGPNGHVHAPGVAVNPALPHLPGALNQYPLVTLMNDKQMHLQIGNYSFGFGQVHAGAGNGGLQNVWGRYPTWIAGTTLTMQGGNDIATAGSVYAVDGATWTGGGEFYVFGELYTDHDFSLGGNAQFYWLYQVRLDNAPRGGFSGANATQTYIAQ